MHDTHRTRSMRTAWFLWMSAFVFVATFTVSVMIWLVRLGWYSEQTRANMYFGVEPPSFAPLSVAVVLFVLSHLLPRLTPLRRTLPRVVARFGEDATYRDAPSCTAQVTNADMLREAEHARRLVNLAWSLVLTLAIAVLGFFMARGDSAHSPRQDPREWWVYFVGCTVAVASHAPRWARRTGEPQGIAGSGTARPTASRLFKMTSG